jgi:hypothetical protein
MTRERRVGGADMRVMGHCYTCKADVTGVGSNVLKIYLPNGRKNNDHRGLYNWPYSTVCV